MTEHVLKLRWVAPPSTDVHPSFALVRHDDRLFSYSELLLHVPFEFFSTGAAGRRRTAQDWWNDLVARRPLVARQAVAMCTPQDFNVLNLYEIEADGSA